MQPLGGCRVRMAAFSGDFFDDRGGILGLAASIAFALIAPQPSHARCRAQFPGRSLNAGAVNCVFPVTGASQGLGRRHCGYGARGKGQRRSGRIETRMIYVCYRTTNTGTLPSARTSDV
jgi:hypothetical protein